MESSSKEFIAPHEEHLDSADGLRGAAGAARSPGRGTARSPFTQHRGSIGDTGRLVSSQNEM